MTTAAQTMSRIQAARNIYENRGIQSWVYPVEAPPFELLAIMDKDEAFKPPSYDEPVEKGESLVFVLQEQYREPKKGDEIVVGNTLPMFVRRAINRENTEWMLVAF